MPQTWIYGTFGDGQGSSSVDGAISISNELPWVKNTDKVTVNIQAEDTASLSIAKDSFRNWKSILKVGKSFIAMVNTDSSVAWNDPKKVLFAGVLTKLNPKLKDVVQLKADGLAFYLSRQAINDYYANVITNPNSAKTLTGSTTQNLIGNLIRAAMDVSAPPAGVRPANVMGTYSDSGTTGGISSATKLTEFKFFGDVLQDIRDNQSDYGCEFRFPPRFAGGAMNRIVFDVNIGQDTSYSAAHLNEGNSYTVTLSSPDALSKTASLEATYNVDGIASRFIGQSKYGDLTAGTGADITSRSNTSSGLPRWDQFFNPGIELTTTQMTSQLASRLQYATDFADAAYSVEEDFDTSWINRLGATLNFVGQSGTIMEGFTMTLRCVSLDFSASNGSVSVGVMVPQPRYPRLPHQKKEDETKKPILPNYNSNVPLASSSSGNPVRPPTSELPAGWSATGNNTAGQLAQNSQTNLVNFNSAIKGEIPSGVNIVDVSFGAAHTVFLGSDGKVYASGNRSYFNLDGSIVGSYITIPYWLNGFTTGSVTKLWGSDNGSYGAVNFAYNWMQTGARGIISSLGIGAFTFGADILWVSGNSVMLTDGTFWNFWNGSFNPASTIAGTWSQVTGVTSASGFNASIKSLSVQPAAGFNNVSKVAYVTSAGLIGTFSFNASSPTAALLYYSAPAAIGNPQTTTALKVTVVPTAQVGTNGYWSSFGITVLGTDNKVYSSPVSTQNATTAPGTALMQNTTLVAGTGNTSIVEFFASAASGSSGGSATTGYNIIAKDSTGRFWVWGSNLNGELGVGDTTARTQFTEYVTSSNVNLFRIGFPGSTWVQKAS